MRDDFFPDDDPTLLVNDGDTLLVGGWSDDLLTVQGRTRGGYVVKRNGHDDTEILSDRDLAASYFSMRLRHWPCNLLDVDERRAKVLKTSFDAWPPAYQRETIRRLTFVEAVETARDAHADVLSTAKAVVPDVHAENIAEWQAEEREAASRAAAGKRRREGVTYGHQEPCKVIKQPEPTTVRTWYSDWLSCGRELMALMPMWHLRGNRNARFTVAKGEDEPDTYKLMEKAAKDGYLNLLRRSKQIAYELYTKLCEQAGVTEVASSRAFRRFLQKRYDEYEKFAARHGKKKAWLRFGVFKMRDLPDRALEEVEVDHCLVDLVVVDEKGRPLGRPWITVLICRATKCIVGLHVSFMPPGHATIQRALVHALYPKDLSAWPHLKNTWDCFGLVEWLIHDRGKEFLGKSFREACLLLSVMAVALPGRRPWLKGSIERIFHTMHARVFDLHEGSTKASDPDTYNPAKRARITRAEFDRMIAEWVVDDYHQRPHPALKRKYKVEMTPSQAWTKLTSGRNRIRFAPDPDVVYQLTCEFFVRKLSPTGIKIKNHVYAGPVLEELAKRDGALYQDWTFRRDRLNLGRIWVRDEVQNSWRIIPNVDPELSDGATQIQFEMWMGAARDITPAGQAVDVDALRRGKAIVEEQRAAAMNGTTKLKSKLKWVIYGEMGGPFTPNPGFGLPDNSDGGRTGCSQAGAQAEAVTENFAEEVLEAPTAASSPSSSRATANRRPEPANDEGVSVDPLEEAIAAAALKMLGTVE